ncbi:hypothetical protein H4217_006905 [Coemansia sp. RSA 1939]|nr:hypothetical protein H4217_006905 [Coemansia sp. RSA 1939]
MPPKRPRNIRKNKASMADWNDTNDTESVSAEETVGLPTTTPSSTYKQSLSQMAHASNDSADHKLTVSSTDGEVSLDDLREFQKYRRHKQRGIDVEALAHGERRKRLANARLVRKDIGGGSKTHPEEGGVGERDDDNDGTAARSLSGAFTAQTNKLDANKHMMSYIEREMAKHRSGAGQDANGHDSAREANPRILQSTKGEHGNNSNDDNGNDDDPYCVPSHLNVIDKKPLSEGNVAMAAKMLTSIQEVDLGTESRAKNIRETNRIVSRLERGTPGGGHQGAETTTGPNPNTHPSSVHSSSGVKFRKHADISDRSSKATDDMVLQRFKKRMRR